MINDLNQPIFVCLTSYQYILADLMAKEEYKNSGIKSIIILKYVNKVKPENNEYADYIIIPPGKLGKLKTLCYSILPRKNWKPNALYFFNDRDPITKNIAKQCTKKILVEEGIGTYFDFPDIKIIGTGIVPDIAYVGYPEIYRETHSPTTFIKKIDYNLLFSAKNIQPYIRNLDVNLSCDILLLGQTTDSDPKYMEYENRFINEFSRKWPGKKMIIKPHPRNSKFLDYATSDDIKLIDEHLAYLPIEILIRSIQVKSIFSLCSSGCITLANICPSVHMILGCNMFNIGLGELAGWDELIKNISVFAKYNKNIIFPQSIEELDKILFND